jgi:ABC-type transporter Mla maintaining outer membrane lipid asymmetry ATPase subunit MlaF
MNPTPDQARRTVIELIEVDIPSRREPNRLALERVTWTVSAGDFWVIGGLQGTGKTDLLATAATVYRPARGLCRLFGREVPPLYSREYLAERMRLALVFAAGGRLFNHLTVRENVALPLDYHQPLPNADARERVEALLEATGVRRWADLAPSTVNPSWRQRVALARALALAPEVLLVDSPLAGLDPSHARWWIEFLDRLSGGHPVMAGRPVTLVVASNDLRPWLSPTRQFALLDGPRFVPVGGMAALGHPPALPVLRELLAEQSDPI